MALTCWREEVVLFGSVDHTKLLALIASDKLAMDSTLYGNLNMDGNDEGILVLVAQRLFESQEGSINPINICLSIVQPSSKGCSDMLSTPNPSAKTITRMAKGTGSFVLNQTKVLTSGMEPFKQQCKIAQALLTSRFEYTLITIVGLLSLLCCFLAWCSSLLISDRKFSMGLYQRMAWTDMV